MKSKKCIKRVEREGAEKKGRLGSRPNLPQEAWGAGRERRQLQPSGKRGKPATSGKRTLVERELKRGRGGK